MCQYSSGSATRYSAIAPVRALLPSGSLSACFFGGVLIGRLGIKSHHVTRPQLCTAETLLGLVCPDLLFRLGEYGKVPAEMESVRVLKMQILEAIAYPPLSSLRSRFCDAGELRKMQTASSD